MPSLGYVEHTLASAVADDGTVAIAYPSGQTRASLALSNGGKVVVDDGAYGSWAEGSSGAEFTYGASTITVTNRSGLTWPAGSVLLASFGSSQNDGSYEVSVGTDPKDAKRGAGTQELTASGVVTPGVNELELNHATVVVAATIATSLAHRGGPFIVKDTSASGTAAHTVTLAHGTWNGTATVITLNAPNEAIIVWFDSAGNGTIVENIGAVALS